MPDWMADITIGQIVFTLGGIALILGIVVKMGRPIKKAQSALEEFMADWNGIPERKDGSGRVIEPARPGVIAQIETVRAQVQNSHSTNLRDDVDNLQTTITELVTKVDEHIDIAKKSDERQDETGRIVDEYLPRIKQLVGDQEPPPAT